jgi:hypothetical protein
MTHDELLTTIQSSLMDCNFRTPHNALRAVVELHKPQVSSFDDTECAACSNDELSIFYPCPTIKAIEQELV